MADVSACRTTALNIAAMAEHWATVIALMGAGGWALYQYVIRRSGESGLLINVTTRTAPYNGDRALFFVDVTLKNTGLTRLDASQQGPAELGKAYEQSLRYAGSLQIRAIRALPEGVVAHLDWWTPGSTHLDPLAVEEINLLAEYTNAEGQVEFFMEPGEEYRLGSAIVLRAGMYLAKIVFVGERDAEYWSRIVPLTVATPQEVTHQPS